MGRAPKSSPPGRPISEQVDRRADAVHVLERRNGRDATRVGDHEFVRILARASQAECGQQVGHDRHVGDVGHVREPVRALGEHGDRHQLQYRVLGARHLNFTTQVLRALDDDLHGVLSMLAP
jgi:hypothetical protein